MPDRLEKLRATVLELERQLQDPSDLDPAARELLTAAARDIQTALSQAEPSQTSAGDESLTSRITDAARQFETEHPTLAGLLERIADGLAQLGI